MTGPRVGDRAVYAPGRPPYRGAPAVWQERRVRPSLVLYVGGRAPEGRGRDVALVLLPDGDGMPDLAYWWAASDDLRVVGRAVYADLRVLETPDAPPAGLAGSTVALDFDGPIHSYSSGWTGYTPQDPPADGALEFVQALQSAGARVVVHTSRADCAAGVRGVEAYLELHGFPPLEVTYEKVPAAAYVDDRAVHFDPRRGFDDALRAEVVRMCRVRHSGEYHPDERTGQAADTRTSASRQHYIDTGEYLPAGDTERETP